MADVVSTPVQEQAPSAGLFTRLVGVVFAPRDAYTAIAAHPKWFGALSVVTLIMIAGQVILLSTDVGRNMTLDQQLSVMKSLGVTVTQEMVQQMEGRMASAPYWTGVSLLVSVPLISVAFAGLLLAIFTAILGGGATFRQVFAVVVHSGIIGAISQTFSLPIMYAREDMSGPTRLAVFFPMLNEMGWANYFFSAIDLFIIWSLINLSIGVAVLYKRQTGSVASVLLGIYAVIAVIIATVRAF